jgi:hypothetical protein
MASKKPDGVIEAVHYQDGRIAAVRAYERRGPTYSDRTIIPRKDLLEKLKKGRKFVTGRRLEFLASTFETGASVEAVGRDGSEWISTRSNATRDELEGVPVF